MQARTDNDTPIIKVTTNEELNALINNSNKSKYTIIRDYLVEKFYGEKFILSDGVEAIMDKSDAQELSHKAYTKKTVVLGNLRKVVESAALAAKTENVSHKKFDAFRYYAVDILYENELYPLLLNVGRSKYTKEHHIYDITKNRRIANQSSTGLSRPEGNAIKNDSSADSIHQEPSSVKSDNKQYFARSVGMDFDTVTRREVADALDSFAEKLPDVRKAKLKGALISYRSHLENYERSRNTYEYALRNGNEELQNNALLSMKLNETVIRETENETIRYDNATANGWDEMAAIENRNQLRKNQSRSFMRLLQ